MTEVVKDFHYYADKAEKAIEDANFLSHKGVGPKRLQYALTAVEAYVELAKAAPKAEKEEPSQFFYFANGERVEGQRCLAQFKERVNPGIFKYSSCVKIIGHDADGEMHETENGVHFDE